MLPGPRCARCTSPKKQLGPGYEANIVPVGQTLKSLYGRHDQNKYARETYREIFPRDISSNETFFIRQSMSYFLFQAGPQTNRSNQYTALSLPFSHDFDARKYVPKLHSRLRLSEPHCLKIQIAPLTQRHQSQRVRRQHQSQSRMLIISPRNSSRLRRHVYVLSSQSLPLTLPTRSVISRSRPPPPLLFL